MRRRTHAALITTATLLTIACAGGDDTADVASTAAVDVAQTGDDEPVDEDGSLDSGSSAADGDLTLGAAPIDLTLRRDDIECDAEALGEDELIVFDVAHYVVDGVLGEVCHGDENPTVIESWELLAAMTPPGQLGDLGLFSGFASGEDGDEVTLAFVSPIDADGTQFHMSVNVDTAQDDPDELQLTMAHEFTHVFAALETQIDRSDESLETCDTYDNGEGCYYDDSLMYAWILEFWDGGLIDEVDPEAEATAASGQDRCDRDAGFFGPYAASTPEEDFAETFSAFVFQVEANTPGQQQRLDWIDDQPGLREFQDRAAVAELGPLDNDFEVCGGG